MTYNEEKAKKIRTEEKSCGKMGLVNKENTCYVNSVMQCLAHIPGFASMFRKSGNEIVQTFSNLLSLLSQSEDVAVMEPNIFRKMIKRELPEFGNAQQHDAHEFLRELLALIVENLEPEEVMRMRTKIEGEIKHSLSCGRCKSVKSKLQRFSDLSLPFPDFPELTLKNLLDFEFSPEDLEAKVECEDCDTRTECTKFSKIVELPRVLTIHLKRFSFNRKSQKISHHVSFPLSGLTVNNATYTLYCIICHHGRTLQSGHYSAYCFNQSDFCWYHYNDDKVIAVSEEIVKKLDAYILFYKQL